MILTMSSYIVLGYHTGMNNSGDNISIHIKSWNRGILDTVMFESSYLYIAESMMF